MPKYQRPKGTYDQYPGADEWVQDSSRRAALETEFRRVCALYGYGEIRTPMFEATELFKRSVGEGTDIVSKEMYSFVTKGGDDLTLRPESTAPVLRAYLENSLHTRGGQTKLFYMAPHFRYERPTKGRYRQHHQFGVEALGADDPALDAEVIGLALAFMRSIGLTQYALKLNSVGSIASRAAFLIALKAYVEPYLPEFGDDGKARFANNALRMLDTKNPRELQILADAPKLTQYLTPDERTHLETLCGYLRDQEITYELAPSLVRGFDYYTKTAFEIQSSGITTAQNALGGGGRYNQLVEDLGGPPTPGIGFGLGVERIMLALQEQGVTLSQTLKPTAFLIAQSEAARPILVRLLAQLRGAGIAADMDYGARSLKAQFRASDRAGARFALIMGDDELAQSVVQVKDLAHSSQVAVPLSEVGAYLRETH